MLVYMDLVGGFCIVMLFLLVEMDVDVVQMVVVDFVGIIGCGLVLMVDYDGVLVVLCLCVWLLFQVGVIGQYGLLGNVSMNCFEEVGMVYVVCQIDQVVV